MLIGELAAKTSVSIDTIRFYEKRGLLHDQHFTRTTNRYRHYSEAAVQRLVLIRQAQAAGITLNEMCQALDEWEQGTINPLDKIAFFHRKLTQLDERIAALERIRTYLKQKLEATETEYRIAQNP